ncbi:MAG: acireductone synthase [Leptolyngbyaceae cyanobacterium]
MTHPMINHSKIKVILLDIEGTTTPIDFVTETLFPYARSRYDSFLQANWASPEVQAIATQLWQDYRNESPPLSCWPRLEDCQGTAAYLTHLTDCDRKLTALKDIQGKIWRRGYEDGSLQGVMYDDVLPAFQQWQTQGQTIAIYSSGSISAQKLIFGYSNVGDLTPYISAYFDTTTGAKVEPDSYQAIANHLGVAPAEIHFYSDNPREVDAAQKAGCQITEVRREQGDSLIPSSAS